MSAARDTRPRGRLQIALLVLCGLALAAIVRVPSFPRPILYAFCLAVFLRITLGRDGDRLAPRRVLQGLAGALAALSVAYLLLALSRTPGEQAVRGEPSALITLMAVVCIFQGLCLLCRQTTFTGFLLILLSSVHASGAAIEFTDSLSLGFVFAYVVLLAWTLLHFERRISLEREADGEGAVRFLRARASRPLPAWSALRVIGAVVLLGFPLGLVLYLAAPRGLKDYRFNRAMEEARRRDRDDTGRIRRGPGEGSAARTFVTGPGDGSEDPWTAVTEIKKDLSAWFEVSAEGADVAPRDIILREDAKDYCTENLTWKDTLSEGTQVRSFVDGDDGSVNGWTPLGHADDTRRGRTLRIALLQGGHKRLFLEPNEVRLRVLRGGLPQSGFRVVRNYSEKLTMSFPFKAGDVLIQRSVRPRTDPGWLRGRASNVNSVPRAYLQVPANCASTCRRLAYEVVGDTEDPWERARKLEAWLKSDAFTYTLRLPPVDPSRAMVEFLTRTRTANCEGFATALTFMLRSLGHPARRCRGFWGGDPQEEKASVVFRGLHYHAWTELYLKGAGWIPLNPTPPDRRAADAGSFTVETGTTGKEDDEAFSFLGYDAKQWSRFWGRVGRGLDRYLVQPVGFLFTREAFYAGPLLLLIALWFLMRRREAQRIRRMVVAPGGRLPDGAYGQALLLLARKGMRRRGNQTARAYAHLAGLRFPRATEPLQVLTRVHERERYGGGAPDAARRRAHAALGALRDALRRKSEPQQS